MIANVQANFENQFINEILRLDDGVARINYGFNSGGYESNVYFYTADGGTLAIDTVIVEIQKVNFNDENDPQWYIIGYDVNYEDQDLYDSHTGQQIIPAYGDE
ncbi:hypothetical protein ENKO_554 [Klebsiella phage fENko-Kae01]|nr:hypothetical protein CPT_Munch_028 [Salmonella phage Munch]WNV47135.1 hypothetical protein [Klebsiella phage fENko-Kae01]WNV47650.1 hypothetical protein [Klebsiella phage fENko-Kae01]